MALVSSVWLYSYWVFTLLLTVVFCPVIWIEQSWSLNNHITQHFNCLILLSLWDYKWHKSFKVGDEDYDHSERLITLTKMQQMKKIFRNNYQIRRVARRLDSIFFGYKIMRYITAKLVSSYEEMRNKIKNNLRLFKTVMHLT